MAPRPSPPGNEGMSGRAWVVAIVVIALTGLLAFALAMGFTAAVFR